MSFKESSGWNEKTELQAYEIFRVLLEAGFPRGLQMELSQKLSSQIKTLSAGNISAKVSNYKSEAGINKPSRSSNDTKQNYEKYKGYSITEVRELIVKMDKEYI